MLHERASTIDERLVTVLYINLEYSLYPVGLQTAPSDPFLTTPTLLFPQQIPSLPDKSIISIINLSSLTTDLGESQRNSAAAAAG